MLILQAFMEIWNNFYAFYRLNLIVFEVLVAINQHSSMISHGKFPACLLVHFTRAGVFQTVDVYFLSAFGIAQRDSQLTFKRFVELIIHAVTYQVELAGRIGHASFYCGVARQMIARSNGRPIGVAGRLPQSPVNIVGVPFQWVGVGVIPFTVLAGK